MPHDPSLSVLYEYTSILAILRDRSVSDSLSLPSILLNAPLQPILSLIPVFNSNIITSANL
jgi:hypothetical protein